MKRLVQTYNNIIDMNDFENAEIDPLDIAHALANKCRFNGHCDLFYSVAKHSLMVAKLVPDEHKFAALLHDAHEAYTGDWVAPMKRIYPNDNSILNQMAKLYKEFEEHVEQTIFKHFGLPWPIHPEIVKADQIMLATEKKLSMKDLGVDWGITEEPREGLFLWGPDSMEVERHFLEAFEEYRILFRRIQGIIMNNETNNQQGESNEQS